MEARLPDEAIIREYLLGRLGEDPELVEQLDEKSLTNPKFSETVDVIEDEIIEEYLEGTLSASDTQAAESHFLRPPERQCKLRNARLLRHHFFGAPSSSAGRSNENVRGFSEFFGAFRWLTPYRTFAEVAAGILLIVSTAYLSKLQRELQTEVRQSAQLLDQERQRTTALNHQLEAALELAHPPTAMLTLLQPGIRRGEAQMPELMVGAGTKNIHVEIALPSGTPGSYSVQLENAGKKLWSQDNLEALTAPYGGILTFNLPVRVFLQGECRFVVRHSNGAATSYSFLVSYLS